MQRNKIAFFVQHMLCGGVENALIALTDKLAEQGHEVTIYVIKNKGEFMRKIPSAVKWSMIPMPEKVRAGIPVGGSKITIKESLEAHKYMDAAYHLAKFCLNRRGFAELNFPTDKVPALEQEFDIAVNFHMHSPFLVWYLSERVNAKRKITWIHNDFLTTGYEIDKLKGYLDCCQAFYCVSQKLVAEFCERIPEFRDKTEVMYNIVPVDSILEKAKESAPEFEKLPDGCVKLLSVGRLEAQKGYHIAVEVCRQLKQAGMKFKWIVLGEGTERARLEKEVCENGLQEEMAFIGLRMNPYPYFRECDIYIQTSLHEGYVTTVTEANIFAKPIVCTDVSGAREQIEDGVNGYVTGFNPDEITEKIQSIVRTGIQGAKENAAEKLGLNVERNLRIFQ